MSKVAKQCFSMLFKTLKLKKTGVIFSPLQKYKLKFNQRTVFLVSAEGAGNVLHDSG